MTFKLFYNDECEGKSVDSQAAQAATKEEILHSMDCVLHVPDNFLGIIDDQDATLQFVVNDDNSIHVDIPVVSRKGSYGKTLSLRECLELVQGVGPRISPEEIEGLEFDTW